MPYRLFALSNAGSMIALLSYPVVVEPFFAVRRQAIGWSVGFLAFCLLCATAALRSRRDESGRMDAAAEEGDEDPGWGTRTLWMALAACASTMLLAVTNHLTQNVAAIPFLWVLPLSLYLLSFILCFSREGRYHRRIYLPLLALALGGMSFLLSEGQETARLELLVPLFAVGLFVCCMVCHGELAEISHTPAASPPITDDFPGGERWGDLRRARCAVRLPPDITSCRWGSPPARPHHRRPGSPVAPGASSRWRTAVLLIDDLRGGLAGALAWQIRETTRMPGVLARNFYGGLKVSDSGSPDSDGAMRTLVHGTITHGRQFLSPRGGGSRPPTMDRSPVRARAARTRPGRSSASESSARRGDDRRLWKAGRHLPLRDQPAGRRLADTEFSS
jgi:hypothetical protein